jgi:hypothetical protein
MSKADDLRAMRERNWHARQKGAVDQTPAQKRAKATEALATALAPKPEVEKVCGTQGIGGKRCIREAGHSEKNHKYGKVETPKTLPPSAAEE